MKSIKLSYNPTFKNDAIDHDMKVYIYMKATLKKIFNGPQKFLSRIRLWIRQSDLRIHRPGPVTNIFGSGTLGTVQKYQFLVKQSAEKLNTFTSENGRERY
jgi:hypothetical protein